MPRIASPPSSPSHLSPSSQLQSRFAAVRISFVWLGVRRALSADQKSQAAQSFGADGTFMSAGKKIWNTQDPCVQTLTSLRNRITSYWRGMSLPFPEPGVRLLRRDAIERFNTQMDHFRAELQEAVAELDKHLDALKADARERLGTLYNESDYPADVRGLFCVQWDYPNVSAPDYLRQVSPELYQEECRRVAARFDQAVELAEQAFLKEFSELVTHLTSKLSGSDGTKQIFKDSSVGNIKDFVARFRNLNIGSNAQLDALVQQAHNAIDGVAPADLRTHEALRQKVSVQMATVAQSLDALMVDGPRRRILRPATLPRQAVA